MQSISICKSRTLDEVACHASIREGAMKRCTASTGTMGKGGRLYTKPFREISMHQPEAESLANGGDSMCIRRVHDTEKKPSTRSMPMQRLVLSQAMRFVVQTTHAINPWGKGCPGQDRFRIKKHISGKRGETCIYTVRSAMLTVLGASAITSSASGYRHELLHHVLLIPRPTHPVEEAAAAGYSEVLVRFLCLLAPFGRSAKMCTC